MEESICRLVTILRYVLDRPVSLDSFDERLVLQKTAYLVQRAGVDLGYRFGWYLRGPYSSDLSNDIFRYHDAKGRYEQVLENYRVTDSGAKKLEEVRRIIVPPEEIPESVWLEMLASARFLCDSSSSGSVEDSDADSVFARLVELKPMMNNRAAFDLAWDRLFELTPGNMR